MRLAIVIAVALTVSGCHLERKVKSKVDYQHTCSALVSIQTISWADEGKNCEPGVPAILEGDNMQWLLRSTAVLCDQTYPITFSEIKSQFRDYTLVCTLSDGGFESWTDVFKRLNSRDPSGEKKRKAEIDRLLKKYDSD